ncbi:GTP-binding protein SAR1 [Mytilus galloprovincialis]|uniref:small monomeric GTPase n=1 Tax=Mytilus galloprovincialis TaxID=29158 RepID=A0A8B6BMP3_MYTGA|nr:GTP-binding protein SAR1 [Mytilus galloprovincialis]
MILSDWVTRILQYFGFINRKCNLLILGLHDSGKSTLLSRLKYGRLVQHSPTNYPWYEEFTIDNVTFTGYDIGGHILALRFWRRYITAVEGIVFVVDASNSHSLPEARLELNSLLTDEDVYDVPVLVLGNKVDKTGCYGKEQLIKELGIDQRQSITVNTEDKSSKRPCTLIMSSVVQQIGYGDGLKWMSTQIKEKDRINKNSNTT